MRSIMQCLDSGGTVPDPSHGYTSYSTMTALMQNDGFDSFVMSSTNPSSTDGASYVTELSGGR